MRHHLASNKGWLRGGTSGEHKVRVQLSGKMRIKKIIREYLPKISKSTLYAWVRQWHSEDVSES